MMRYLYGLFFLILFGGCTTTTPPITEYKLNTHIQTQSKKSCNKSLKITKAFGINNINSLKMSYMQGDYKVFGYNQSRWSQYPSEAITDEFVKSFKEAKLFKNVISYKSRANADLLLELHVEEFIQHYTDTLKSSFASVIITVNLIDTTNSKMLYTHTFTKHVDAKTLDANGGVVALSKALSSIIDMSIKDIQKVCR